MPGYDGTGPMGQGPLTGRAMGRCAGVGPAAQGRPLRLGCGWGGRGRGFRNRLRNEPTVDQRCAELESRIAELQQELDELKRPK
jgi:hypothetical protein